MTPLATLPYGRSGGTDYHGEFLSKNAKNKWIIIKECLLSTEIFMFCQTLKMNEVPHNRNLNLDDLQSCLESISSCLVMVNPLSVSVYIDGSPADCLFDLYHGQGRNISSQEGDKVTCLRVYGASQDGTRNCSPLVICHTRCPDLLSTYNVAAITRTDINSP